MNKYEKRAMEERKASVRSLRALWTGGLVLAALVFAILRLSSGGPSQFSRAAIVLAILLLVFRQITRRLRSRLPKAAQPDPQSRLNLD